MKTIKSFFNDSTNQMKIGVLLINVIFALLWFGIQYVLMWLGTKFIHPNMRDDAFAITFWFMLYIPSLIAYLMNTYEEGYNVLGCFLALIGIYVCVVWYCSTILLAAFLILLIYNVVSLEHQQNVAYRDAIMASIPYVLTGIGILYSLSAYFAMDLMGLQPAMSQNNMYLLLATAIFLCVRPLFLKDYVEYR